jgi:hypothetical protein
MIAVKEVADVEADDYFVFAVSDANLSRYGIAPDALGKALVKDERVNAYCIFIASLQDEVLPNNSPHVGASFTNWNVVCVMCKGDSYSIEDAIGTRILLSRDVNNATIIPKYICIIIVIKIMH